MTRRPGRGRRRSFLVSTAVAAAAVALATAAGCGVDASRPSGSPHSAFVGVDIGEWTRHDFGPAVGNRPPSFLAGAVHGRTFVAVGVRATGAASSQALLWHSPDAGTTWREGVTGLPARGPGALAAVHTVVRRAADFVALGTLGAANADPHPAVALTSADGARWLVRPVRGVDGSVAALTVADGGLVAVGSYRGHAAVWRSRDGVVWFRLTGPAQPGHLDAVAARGDVVVAAGADGGATVVAQIGAESWRAGRPPRDGATVVRRMGARDADVLLAATACTREATCEVAGWVTADGARWRRIPMPSVDAGAIVVTTEGNRVRVGAAGALYRSHDADGWTAFDGLPLDSAHVLLTSADGHSCVVGNAPRRDANGLVGPAAACWEGPS